MKIAIIGFGAASIGFIGKIKSSPHEFHVFEKSKDIHSSSISGIRADGKLFVSSEMGGDIFIDRKIQQQLVNFYLDKTSEKQCETGKSFHNSKYYEEFYRFGFMPVSAEFYHVGTDQLKGVLDNVYEYFRTFKNLHFHFNALVTDIEVKNNKILINQKEEFDAAVVSAGRSGHKLIKAVIQNYPELVLENTVLDLGVRFEMPDHIVNELNKEMYEFKVKYRSKTGYMVRTFCNNPSGYVVNEKYDDFVTVNGHAKMNQKSTNTNFAVLTTVELTVPFNDPIGYGSHIAKLTNLLAGKDKVILQTYKDLKNSKRTKKLYRVLPTLPEESYILGDINLAFPRRIIESIIDFVEQLDKVVPGVANDDNLVYAPEIKFYSNKLNNEYFKNLKFIGDCSGYTRSIIYATAHGYLMGDEFLK